jgi:small-conductance mechanosensitive channel
MKLRGGHHFSVLLFLLLFSFGLSNAQSDLPLLPNGQPDSSLIKKIAPIPINQVPAKIEDAESSIKNGEKKILPKKAKLEIDSLFPIYISFLNAQKNNAQTFIKANPNRQKIDNLINKWNGYYGQLEIWQNTINELEDKNMDLIAPFKEKEYQWSITLDLAIKEDAPPSLVNNIKRTLRDISNIKQSIINENNELINLETSIIQEKSMVSQTIEQFIELKNSEIYTVFYHRHKALWKTSFKTALENESKSSELETIPNKFSNIGEYLKENQKQVYYFLSIIALIILMLFYFKKAFKAVKFTEQDANLQRAKDIVASHTAAAIIFIIGITGLLFLNNLPFLLIDILIVITLISSVPMLKALVYTRFEKIFYLIIIFYVINAAKTYIWFSSPYYRLYLLIEAIIMLIVLHSFSKPYLETRKVKTSFFGTIVIRSIPVFYVLILIAIISNLLGYTNLTDLTLKTITLSSALTIIFYGLLMVSSGLIVGGIHLAFIKQESYIEERKFLVEKKALNVIRVIIILWWFFYFLGILDLRSPVTSWLSDFMIKSYNFGSVTFTLQEILTFVLVLIISFTISNFISMILDGGALNFLKLPKGIPAAISLVLRYFIIAFGFVLAISALGIDLSSFNLMAGALGLGIGFGLQTIISNFVSGIILVFERPILPGDTVEVKNLMGKVTNIGVRASRVRTFDGAEVVVPNNNLISNDLINWTLSDSVKRIEILIGTAYGSDPNIVLKILQEEALKNEFTLTDPEPIAFFKEFGDSSLNFRLLVWVPFEKGLISKSNISVGIYNSFKEHGIEIPFPQRDIHVKALAEKKNEIKKEITKPIRKSDPNTNDSE